jgi:hypothetical protein
MDKLIEFAIQNWPGPLSIFLLIAMILIMLLAPVYLFWLINKLKNKDRYVFAQDKNHLYCLDTNTGNIRVARGLVFQEIPRWEKNKSEEICEQKNT